MISMVGIVDKNGANQQSCYKHSLRSKGKVHFEPRFGGRPWFLVVKWNILHLPSTAAKALAIARVGRVTAPFGGDPTEAEAQPSIIVYVDGDKGRVCNMLILLPLALCLSS